MNTQTWTNPHIDRTGWGAGEWDGEPDNAQWTDQVTHLPCLAVRNHINGSWRGYVGVPAGHPLHGVDFHDLPYLQVHGGITFASACGPGPVEGSICHVPAPGEPDDVYWLGFDCAHAWDFKPGVEALLRSLPGAPARRTPGPGQLPAQADVYRTLAYVQAQCARLAKQVFELTEAM